MAAGVWSFRNSRLGLYALPVIAIAGCAIWLMLPGPSDAQNPDTSLVQNAASLNTAVTTTDTPEVATSPLDGLKISSQSWRRGGLGSKALVTFTLRNGNEYAVKDIEIACAFTRRDGRHLTDRKRLINDAMR